jgi:hypothetical protein
MAASEETRCLCRRHEPTNLRCARCETPICPECAVSTVTGFICRKCASPTNVAALQLDPGRALLAFAVCLALSTIGGWLFGSFIGRLGFFSLWGGVLFGGLNGDLALRVSGRKRGPIMEAIAGGSTLLGMLAGYAIWAEGVAARLQLGPILLLPTSPWIIASFAIAVFISVSRIRYM